MDDFILQNSADMLLQHDVQTTNNDVSPTSCANWKIKRLTQLAKLPVKAHSTDLGYDLFSAEGCSIEPGKIGLVSTGLACIFPPGIGSLIRDRSSIATKLGLIVCAGVIDNGYTGEIKIALFNSTDKKISILTGTKIAQMILTPVISADSAEVTSEEFDKILNDKINNASSIIRGASGFGSTGI